MWEKEKHGGRVDLRASLYYLVCVHTVCMGLACVCVWVCVFPGSREAKQRLTSSRRPWVCMCLPLCKASLLLTNPMRLENAAARARGRATRRPGKTYKAGALVGRDGTRLDDDRDRNTSISLGHFGTFLGWFYDILCGRKVLVFCIIDDQTLALLISSHGSDLLRRRCCSGPAGDITAEIAKRTISEVT